MEHPCVISHLAYLYDSPNTIKRSHGCYLSHVRIWERVMVIGKELYRFLSEQCNISGYRWGGFCCYLYQHAGLSEKLLLMFEVGLIGLDLVQTLVRCASHVDSPTCLPLPLRPSSCPTTVEYTANAYRHS